MEIEMEGDLLKKRKLAEVVNFYGDGCKITGEMRLIIGRKSYPICRKCRALHGRQECPRRNRGARGETSGGKLLRELAKAYASDQRKFA